MSKVYVENKGITLAQQDREAIASHLEQKAAKNGPGSIAGDLNVTVNGTTYSGTVLVAGARQTITFTVRSKAAAAKKEAKPAAGNAPAKKAAPKKAAASK